MPVITFTEDVTLESEGSETGPHYRAGYCVDVADKIAQGWVTKGVAVYGKVEIAVPPPIAEPVVEESVEEEKPKRRRKRWTPDD